MKTEFIFVDTEYTTFGPTRETGWPKRNHHKEIVQIAAVRFDMLKGKEIEGFEVLVKPRVNPILSNFFIELTGITQESIEKDGLSFASALGAFLGFLRDSQIWTFDRDWFVFEENCKLNEISFPFANREFTRVKPQLKEWGIDPEKYSSGTLYKAVGLEMEGHVHNALHDVRSMAAAISRLHNTGRTNLNL